MHFHRPHHGRPVGSPASGARAAILLPPGLESRTFAPAWALAFAAHLALTTVVAMSPVSRPPDEPPIRLVFVEPPPPAPLGAATGTATAPGPAETPPVSHATETPEPAPSEPERLRRPRPDRRPRPRVATKPRPAVVPPPPPAAGNAAGAIGGEAGGVVGGIAGGTGTAPVPASQVAHPPEVIRRVRPIYPADARRREIEGLVVIEAVLDRDGHIEPGVKVLKSVPQLDAEAVAAVRQWRFRPARNAAREPLRVILEIPIRFVLT